jgi:hypothetical protein
LGADSEVGALTKYGLSEWPFREVPEQTRCTFLAGRPELSQVLDRLIGSPNSVSSVHLFWASLGAGKTHALYYLMNKMRSSDRFLPIYTEYPETQASFLELYQLLSQRVPWEQVADSCLYLFTNPDPTANEGLAAIKAVYPDLYRAFFLLAEGEDPPKSRLARRWLRGEQLVRVDLRTAGFAQSLASPSDCAAAISVLARVLGLKASVTYGAAGNFRIVWILDESQRLRKASQRVNQEVNAGLQSAFNSTPDYLSLVLSFSGVPEPKLPDWLRPELADRIGIRNLILLPPLGRVQAMDFFRELLSHFRNELVVPTPFFPFTERAIDHMIGRVTKGKLALIEGFVEKDGVRPRALVKCAHAVLEEHVALGLDPPIDETFVARLFPK